MVRWQPVAEKASSTAPMPTQANTIKAIAMALMPTSHRRDNCESSDGEFAPLVMSHRRCVYGAASLRVGDLISFF